MPEAGAVLLTLAAFLFMIYFSRVPLPDTSFEPVDYILRAFFHADVPHLLANILTMLRLGYLSANVTIATLIKMLIFLTLTSSLLLYIAHALFPQFKKTTIGFSGVLFGLIVVKNVLAGADLETVMIDVSIQLLPDLLEPQISFLGHFLGAVSGFLYVLLFSPQALGRVAQNLIDQ